MLVQENKIPLSLIDSLTESLRVAHEKVKALINRIYKTIKKQNVEQLKSEFWKGLY